MKDMIISSYGGFVKNGNKNGYVSFIQVLELETF